MDIIHLMFVTGELVIKCVWAAVVLLPKGGGEYCGIGLLEVLFKVVYIIINQFL